MTRVLPLSERVPIADDKGYATAYFSRQWQGLANVPTVLLGGRLQIEATTDTLLTISYRGSDGVLRSGTIALS